MLEAKPRKRTAGATPLSSCRLGKVIRKIPFAPAFQSSEIETALSKIRTHHVMKKTMATLILVFLLPPAGFVQKRAARIPSALHPQDAGASNPVAQSIPTVGFCEMVRNAKLYFDKQVRILAKYQMATEGQYLSDERCPLSHDDQIGVGHAPAGVTQSKILNATLSKVGEVEYGGQALVTVVGVLRNSSLRAFSWYQYRFDIIRVENVAPVIVLYEGELQGSVTYRGTVRWDRASGLSLIPEPGIAEHHAMRIEWTNLRVFPKLRNRAKTSEQRLVFTVRSDEIKQMTELRWNRTVRCKIIRLE